jgi:hypothetical protein
MDIIHHGYHSSWISFIMDIIHHGYHSSWISFIIDIGLSATPMVEGKQVFFWGPCYLTKKVTFYEDDILTFRP